MSDDAVEVASSTRGVPGWRRYFTARCISAAGSSLTWIALPVLAYQLTGSVLWTALVVAFDAVPYLMLGLWAGRSADLWDRKVIIVISDVVSGLALLTVPLASALDSLSPWHVAIVAFAAQSCFVFGDAAHLGGLPTLVGKDNVMAANSRLYGYIGILECIVPALGGLALTQVSAVTLLAVDGATFLACAALIGTLRGSLSPSRAERELAETGSILRGLRYSWKESLIRDTTMVNLMLSIGNGAFFAMLVIWADTAHGIETDDVRLGLLYAAVSVGGVVGSFAVERVAALGPPRQVIGATCALAGFSALGGVWAPWLPAGFLLFAVFSGATFCAMVIGVSIRQSRAPSHMVALVNTTGRMLALGIGFPLGAFGSAIVSRITDSTAVGMSVAFVAVAATWPALARSGAGDDDVAPPTAADLASPETPTASGA